MDKEHIAYCGLDCEKCKRKFTDIRHKFKELNKAFEKVNIQEMVKVIPFMNSKYRGYKKMSDFFSHECPGCRDGGGNPFCGIRKCSSKRHYSTCAECNTSLCKKFKNLFKVHNDNEIQDSIKQIKDSLKK